MSRDDRALSLTLSNKGRFLSASTPTLILTSEMTDSENFNPFNILFNYPQYFRYFFKFNYYLLVTPFYISFRTNGSKTVAKLETNFLQKLLCFTFQFLLFLATLSRLAHQFTINIFSDPTLIFTACVQFALVFQFYAFVYTLWFRQHALVAKLFESSKPVTRSNMLVPVALILWDISSWLYYQYREYRPFFQTGDIRYAVGYTNWLLLIQKDPSPLPQDQTISGSEYLLTIVMFLVFLYARMTLGGAEVFTYISAFSIYDVAKTFDPHFSQKNSENEVSLFHRHVDADELYEKYKDMQNHLRRINSAVSNMFLWNIAEFLTFLAKSLFIILANERPVEERIATGLQFVKYTGTLIVAAEAYDKATSHKEKLMEQMCESQSKNYHSDAVFLEATSYQLGLMGGKFFTVTYGFVGTTISVLLTYVLVMVQFQIPTISGDETNHFV